MLSDQLWKTAWPTSRTAADEALLAARVLLNKAEQKAVQMEVTWPLQVLKLPASSPRADEQNEFACVSVDKRNAEEGAPLSA